VQAGDVAPDFTLNDQGGIERSLSALLVGGPVVLFFYPAALTTGCTKESCHFRDLAAQFDELGAQRIGISMDDEAHQAEFTSRNQLDYPLLCDLNGRVAARFGVKRHFNFLRVRRATFIIGQDQRIIEVINSELNMNAHAERALIALRTRGV